MESSGVEAPRPQSVEALLAAADAAMETCMWTEASTLLQEAARLERSAAVLERLANVAWWLDDVDPLFAAREELFRLASRSGNVRAAAYQAVLISWDYSFFKGERAVAEGWLSRAESLLDGNGSSLELGWVLVRRASLLADEDSETAARLADDAVAIARAQRSVDLEVAALSLWGLTLVEQGVLQSGMRRLTAGAAAACAGETDHPVAVTLACCYTIGACERVRDFDRAGQWVSRMVDRFERRKVPSFASFCRAQYGAVLLALGQWQRAGEILEREARALDAIAPSAAASARTSLAELRRRQGHPAEADALLDQAEPHLECLVVRAAMALDANAGDEALDAIDPYLRRTSADRVLDRARALELVVRIQAARGAVEEAKAAAEELSALVKPVGAPAYTASALLATATAALCADELRPASAAFEDAATLFEQSQMPWEAAQAWDGAATADERLGRIGAARRERRRSASLRHELTGGTSRSVLTGREREVLTLVAEGLSDAGIASRLVLSRHTVHRHVANAMRKLGASTRAAAVARAGELGLL